MTYRDLVFPESDAVPELEVSPLASLPSYEESEPPVIFGHYWMRDAVPRCLAANAACVGYSVAAQQGGLLSAYRWRGEAELSDQNFVTPVRL